MPIRNSSRLVLLAALLLCAICLAAEPLKVEVQSVSKQGTVRAVLGNGLTVLLKENHSSPAVHIRVVVHVGSVLEEGHYGCGLSHQVEHLMHSPTTKTRTSEQAQKMLENMGGQTNAFTAHDETAYYITTTKGHLDEAIGLLADWVVNPRITRKEFEREMGVITREVEREQASAEAAVWREFNRLMFTVHPCRLPIIGYNPPRQALKLADVEAFRKRYYVPNNMMIAAAGDFAWKDALGTICRSFAGFERGVAPTFSLPEEPEQLSPREVERSLPDLQAVHLAVGFRTVSLTHPDMYALDVLSDVLGGGESARLVRRLAIEDQIVQRCHCFSWTPGYNAGVFGISALLGDYKNVAAAREAIWQELDRVKAEQVSAKELDRVKAQVAARAAYNSESIEQQTALMVSGEMSAGDPDFDRQYVDRIRAVTAEQVMQVARKYFDRQKQCVVVIKPQGAGEQAATAAAGIEQGKIKKLKLTNGATLLLERNTAAPVFSMQAFFQCGLRTETAKDNGISSMVATMIMQGTKTRSKKQLDEEIESLGAGLGAESGNYTLFVRSTGLAGDFEKVLDIFADVILNPAFEAKELERQRKQTLYVIQQADDDVRSQARRLLARTFYRTGPYSMDRFGTEETVKAFTVDQLAAYHKRYIVPNNMVIAVFGDIDPDGVQKAIEAKFAGFQPNPDLNLPGEIPAQKLDLDILETAYRRQKDAAAIYVAYPGMSFKNVEDRYAMDVLDAILSGARAPGGWLHSELRGKKLVYEVHAYSILGLDPRHFEIFAMTRPDTVDQVLAIIDGFIGKMKRGKFTDDELDRAKTLCATEETLEQRGNANLAAQAALDELYGLGYDFSQHYTERINAVTRADVIRVANKYLAHKVTAMATSKEGK